MPHRMQRPLPPMEVKTVDFGRTTVGTPAGQNVVPPEANGLSLLVTACAETCSDKDAYISLGLPDAPYWSKVKIGDKPAPRVNRLTDLPISTQRAYVKRWGRQLGMRVSDENSAAAAIAELVVAAATALKEVAR